MNTFKQVSKQAPRNFTMCSLYVCSDHIASSGG